MGQVVHEQIVRPARPRDHLPFRLGVGETWCLCRAGRCILEAVANKLGVGFGWEHGSSRVDRIAKVLIAEMEAESPEYIFSLAGKRGRLVELFFHAHRMSPYGEAVGLPIRPAMDGPRPGTWPP